MVIFSFKEEAEKNPVAPDESFFLQGNDRLCFLIHGLTGTPREMGFLAHRLHRAGYSAAAPLMKGHNMTLSTLKKIRWQDFYAAMKEKFLEQAARCESVFVAGLSFGALLGLCLAHEFPRKVKALICLSPTLFFDGWSTPKSRVLLPLIYRTPLKYNIFFKEESPYGIKNERLRSRIESYYKKAKLDDYEQIHLHGYPAIPVSCMYQNHLLANYVSSLLGTIRNPALLVQAKDDDVTSPRNSEYIYQRLGSSDKEICFLEDSYHIITADQEREKVAQRVISFLNKY